MKVSKQIVDKRRSDVMKYIQENQNATVDELADRFNISAVTIRRDLQYWESVGAIERKYGGATLIEDYVNDNKTYDRYRYMKAIAKRASLYVEDNDVIFINTSMTSVMMIDYIKYKNVTIITNNAKAINSDPDSNVTIIFTGGEVRYPKHSMTGDIALKVLGTIIADKCFIGCSGLSTNGASTGLIKETSINKLMLERTKGKKFLLCDHTKVGLDFSYRYCDLNDVDYLITDTSSDDEILEEITEDKNVEVVKVEPLNRP